MLNAYIRRINNLPQSDQGLSLELVMPSYSCGVDVAVALSIRCLLESEASVRVSHNTKNRHRAILLGPYGPSCFCRGPLASVFGEWYGGGSTAARVIVRQLQLVASTASAVFGVLNDQALDTLYRGLGFRTKIWQRAILPGRYGPSCIYRGSRASVFGGGDGGGSTRTPLVQAPHE
jgi:hypothetical protein